MTVPSDSAFGQLGSWSIKARNLKCFHDSWEGFDSIKSVNLIVGRNNSGKSSLVDVIYAATVRRDLNACAHLKRCDGPIPFQFSTEVSADVPTGHSDSHFVECFAGLSDKKVVEKFVGSRIEWSEVQDGTKVEAGRIVGPGPGAQRFENMTESARTKLIPMIAQRIKSPFEGIEFRRLRAERDIQPEPRTDSKDLHENGTGATNLVQTFLHRDPYDASFIESTLLAALNRVMNPDSHFSRIWCREISTQRWEIFLDEDEKKNIPLSKSGSGLKTVFLVLLNLLLIPKISGRPLSKYILAFEELENNLHPAVLRRLLAYVAELATSSGCVVFVTTHSSAAIDMFSRDEGAQIIHVRHEAGVSRAAPVVSYIQNRGVLDDLDVRASDLLQANGIIWVEGPTDRIYVNRWIHLWSQGKLSEGLHYQCVFYGGRLLSHLDASAPGGDPADGVAILRAARNAAVVIDSDKRSARTQVNATKRRIQQEILSVDGMAWVTAGREIENYVSAEVWSAWSGMETVTQPPQYDCVFDVLESVKRGLGDEFREKKPILAERLCQHMTYENSRGVLDLDAKVSELCRHIRRWNGMSSGETTR